MKTKLIVSLAAVMLLASCNNGQQRGLTPCNEHVAAQVAQRIYNAQDTQQDPKLTAKYGDLYNYLPTSIRKFNMTIDYSSSYDMSTYTESAYSYSMHKICNFDLDKMCYTCDFESQNIVGGQTINTKSKYYLFFVLDKEQEEDVKEENRMGTVYQLVEYNGVKRRLDMDHYNFQYFMNNYMKGAIYGSSLADYEYSCEDDYYDSSIPISDDFIIYGTDWEDYDSIFEDSVLTGLYYGNIENWAETHFALQLLEDKDVYYNPSYGSNNPLSLSINIDGQVKTNQSTDLGDGQTMSMDMFGSQKKYIEYQNAYCAQAEFTSIADITNVKLDDKLIAGMQIHQEQYMKRVNNYGSANCSIPGDIDQYLPI